MNKIYIHGKKENFLLSKLAKSLATLNIPIIITDEYTKDCSSIIRWEFYEKEEMILGKVNCKFINQKFLTNNRYFLEKFHEAAFGQDLNVNPLTYEGEIFRKGICHHNKFLSINERDYHCKNGNPYYHWENGKVRYMTFKGPIDYYDDKSVYQKNINRKIGDDLYVDYRLTIINRKPFLLVKTLHSGFISDNFKEKKSTYYYPNDFFKKDYLDKLDRFLNMIELDYADLDLIIEDDNIYICDINNTPMCGGTTPQDWYKEYFPEFLKEICKMLNIKHNLSY